MTGTARKAPPFADAEQIRWQRQVTTVLGRLLELAAKRDLPAINWTVSYAGATLAGECLAYPHSDRRAQIEAWRQALGEPHTFRETDMRADDVQLTAIWDRTCKNPLLSDRDGWQLATVIIQARILPLLDDESQGA